MTMKVKLIKNNKFTNNPFILYNTLNPVILQCFCKNIKVTVLSGGNYIF